MVVLQKVLNVTFPVFLGYFVMGIAYGMLMNEAGYPWYLAAFASIVVYAGSLQFALVALLSVQNIDFINLVLMTVIINCRMLFYALPLVSDLKKMGWKKWYILFALSDETFSIALNTPKEERTDTYLASIALANQVYWTVGSVVGVLLGSVIPFDTTGIEFSMTALFIVIVIEQWKKATHYEPFFIGVVIGTVALFVIGPQYFLMYAMVSTIVLLVCYEEYRELRKGRENI